MHDFAEKIRSLKAQKGLTGQELSEKSGIPLGTLTKLLSGAIEEPKLSTAISLCEALGTSLGAMLGDSSATATSDESRLLADYRACDDYGKALIRKIAEMECGRTADSESAEESKTVRSASAEDSAVITLPLYLMPVSAGTGTILDSGGHETIDVRATFSTEQADFALRVSGNSMEPRFRDGDIVLVHQQNTLLFGELGIFVADGKGYFKRYMGDRLHSLNPEYPDIPLCRFSDFLCCGKVVGHMKKKTS